MATHSHGVRDQHHHAPNGQIERTADTAERDAEAVRLRAQRLSYRDIAARLGFAHPTSAKRACARGLAAIPRDAAAELLAVENLCLDQIDTELDTVIATRWPLAQIGKIVTDANGIPLEDPSPRLKAAELRLKSAERRSRLNGYDAPRQSVRWDITVIESQIGELEAQLRAAGITPPAAGHVQDDTTDQPPAPHTVIHGQICAAPQPPDTP